jgi:hypothetical protein
MVAARARLRQAAVLAHLPESREKNRIGTANRYDSLQIISPNQSFRKFIGGHSQRFAGSRIGVLRE